LIPPILPTDIEVVYTVVHFTDFFSSLFKFNCFPDDNNLLYRHIVLYEDSITADIIFLLSLSSIITSSYSIQDLLALLEMVFGFTISPTNHGSLMASVKTQTTI